MCSIPTHATRSPPHIEFATIQPMRPSGVKNCFQSALPKPRSHECAEPVEVRRLPLHRPIDTRILHPRVKFLGHPGVNMTSSTNSILNSRDRYHFWDPNAAWNRWLTAGKVLLYSLLRVHLHSLTSTSSQPWCLIPVFCHQAASTKRQIHTVQVRSHSYHFVVRLGR